MRGSGYVRSGREAILHLLDHEHAAVWPEIEAKIADQLYLPLRVRVDPHHLSTAKQELLEDGEIVATVHQARGGRDIRILHLPETTGRKRLLSRAAGRKRLLQARFLGWAVTNRLVGPAGERVLHASLIGVSPERGYRMENASATGVPVLLGDSIPAGPLDNTAHLPITDARGVTQRTVTLPIEVKNVRDWIYPENYRLHQLLYKASVLQQAHRDVPIVPVLVCRRAHITTYWMASVFGFYVAAAKAQFVLRTAEVPERLLNEVRDELGYDLEYEDSGSRLLRHHFAKALPGAASELADKWAELGSSYADFYQELRDPGLDLRLRGQLKKDLSLAVMEARSPAWEVPAETEDFESPYDEF